MGGIYAAGLGRACLIRASLARARPPAARKVRNRIRRPPEGPG